MITVTVKTFFIKRLLNGGMKIKCCYFKMMTVSKQLTSQESMTLELTHKPKTKII